MDAGGGDEEGIGVQDVEGLVESLMEGEEVEEVEYVEREEGMEQVTGLEGLEGLKEKFEGIDILLYCYPKRVAFDIHSYVLCLNWA